MEDSVKIVFKELAKKIKQARSEVGKSQFELAVYIGVTDKAISGYEAGRITPTLEKLVLISEFFKKPIGYFLGADTREYTMASRLRSLEVTLREVRQELNQLRLTVSNVPVDQD